MLRLVTLGKSLKRKLNKYLKEVPIQNIFFDLFLTHA